MIVSSVTTCPTGLISVIKFSWFSSFLLVTMGKVTPSRKTIDFSYYSTINTVYTTFIMVFDASVWLVSGEGQHLLDSTSILVKGKSMVLRIQCRNATENSATESYVISERALVYEGFFVAGLQQEQRNEIYPTIVLLRFVFCRVCCNVPCQFTPLLIRGVSFSV